MQEAAMLFIFSILDGCHIVFTIHSAHETYHKRMQTHVDLQSYRPLMRMHWPFFEPLATPVSEELLCKARTCILYGSYICCNLQSPICCIIAEAWGKSRLVGGSHTICAPTIGCWILSSCSKGGSYGRKRSIMGCKHM